MSVLTLETSNPVKKMPVRKYESVRITLDNVLMPKERVQKSPSSQDGLDKETELDLRIHGCELIQTSGILLKLPQVNAFSILRWSNARYLFEIWWNIDPKKFHDAILSADSTVTIDVLISFK